MTREVLRLPAPPGEPVSDVRAVADRPAAPRGRGLVLTHGAGGDVGGAGLEALATGLAAEGVPVVRFNLPYREAGRASPPAAERSLGAYGGLFEEVRRRFGPRRRWAAGGKSYGGRVASLAVAQGMPASALVFYGYPLHAPGRHEAPRVAHWPAIEVPCLFLQGTHDPFCDLGLLAGHLASLGGPATVQVVEGGDHSLAVTAARAADGRARREAEVLAGLAPLVAGWLRRIG